MMASSRKDYLVMMPRLQEMSDATHRSSGISFATMEQLRQTPAFPGTVRGLLARLIAMYDANRLLNRLLCDRGRAVVGLFALYLHYLPPPGEAEAGLTLSRLQGLCRLTGVCSSGRAAALMSMMRFGGYLTPGLAGQDRRRRVLVPSDLFLREQQHRWQLQFEAMAPLFASGQAALEALGRVDFTRAFLSRLGDAYFAGFRITAYVPTLADLVESNAALLMLGELVLRSGESAPALQGQPIAISTSALARRFGVARAHVRNLLVEAEKAGLVRRGDEDGCVIVLPALVAAVETFFAAAFLLFSNCARMAIEDIRLQPRPARGAASEIRAISEHGADLPGAETRSWNVADGGVVEKIGLP
jgi:hypothetical protein